MPNVSELGAKVKAKNPGAYDDIPDDEVGRRVRAKYPGAYDDFSDDPSSGRPAAAAPTLSERLKAKRAAPEPPPDGESDGLGQADPAIPEAPAPKPTRPSILAEARRPFDRIVSGVKEVLPSASAVGEVVRGAGELLPSEMPKWLSGTIDSYKKMGQALVPSGALKDTLRDAPAKAKSILDSIAEGLGASTDLPTERVRADRPLYAGGGIKETPHSTSSDSILGRLPFVDAKTQLPTKPVRPGTPLYAGDPVEQQVSTGDASPSPWSALVKPVQKASGFIKNEITGPLITDPLTTTSGRVGDAAQNLGYRTTGNVIKGGGRVAAELAGDPLFLGPMIATGGGAMSGPIARAAMEGVGVATGVPAMHHLASEAIPEAIANYGTATPEEKDRLEQDLAYSGVGAAAAVPGLVHGTMEAGKGLGAMDPMAMLGGADTATAAGLARLRRGIAPAQSGAPTPARRWGVDTRAETAAPWAPALDDTIAAPTPASAVGKSNDVLWGGTPEPAPIRRGVRYVRQDDGSFLPGVKRPGPMEVGGSNRGMPYDMNNGPGTPWDPLYDQFARTGAEANPAEQVPSILPPRVNAAAKPAPDFEPAPWADLIGGLLNDPVNGGKRFAQQLQQAQGRGGYGPIIDSLESILPPRPPAPADPRRGLKAVPPPEPVTDAAPDQGEPAAGSGPVAVPGGEVGGGVSDGEPAPKLVPERPKTLAAQVERGEQGKASAIMIPKGQPVPARPKGWRRVDVRGDAPATWFYDPKVYNKESEVVTGASTDQGRARLLGKLPKPIEGPQAVISTKQPDGVPVEDTVVGPETAAATIQDQVAKAAPGEQVVVETPQDTLDQRVAPEKPAPAAEVDDRTDAELKQKLSEVQEKLMFSMGSLNRTPERMAELELLREQDKYYRGELARRRAAAAAAAAPATPVTPTEAPAPVKKPGLAERIRGKKKEDAPLASAEPAAVAPTPEVVPWGDEEIPQAAASAVAQGPETAKTGEAAPVAAAPPAPSQPPPSEAVKPGEPPTQAEGGGATTEATAAAPPVEDLGPSGLKMDEIAMAAARLNIPLPSRESLRDPVDAVIARAQHDFEAISRAMHSKEKVELRPELSREEAYVGLSQFRDMTDKQLPRLTEELEQAHASGDQAAVKGKQDQIDGVMINAAALADRLYRGGSEAGRRLAFQKIMAPDAADVIDPLLAIKKGQQLTGGKLTPDMQKWIIEKSAKAQRDKAAITLRVQERAAEAMERLKDPAKREQLKDFDKKKLEGCE